MTEKNILIKGEEGNIEGKIAIPSVSTKKALIALHPHPLFGGSMENNVVECVVNAAYDLDFITFRINFRGVGRSEGRFAEGIGEVEDVFSAWQYLKDTHTPDLIVIAGYSFGAIVGLRFLNKYFKEDPRLILISPPPFLMDKREVAYYDNIYGIIVGSQDEIAPIEKIKETFFPDKRPLPLYIIEGADHFYWGYEKRIDQHLKEILGTLES